MFRFFSAIFILFLTLPALANVDRLNKCNWSHIDHMFADKCGMDESYKLIYRFKQDGRNDGSFWSYAVSPAQNGWKPYAHYENRAVFIGYWNTNQVPKPNTIMFSGCFIGDKVECGQCMRAQCSAQNLSIEHLSNSSNPKKAMALAKSAISAIDEHRDMIQKTYVPVVENAFQLYTEAREKLLLKSKQQSQNNLALEPKKLSQEKKPSTNLNEESSREETDGVPWWVWAIGIVVFLGWIGGGSSKSSYNGAKRDFECHECGANSWTQTNESFYENASPGSYNYKEWLTCGKCGNRITNERRV